MTSQDLEARIEKCRNDVRKLETSCLLGGARLALLRIANVDVDSWTESAKIQVRIQIEKDGLIIAIYFVTGR